MFHFTFFYSICLKILMRLYPIPFIKMINKILKKYKNELIDSQLKRNILFISFTFF